MCKMKYIHCFHFIQLCSLQENLVVGLGGPFAKGLVESCTSFICDCMALRQFIDSRNRNSELGVFGYMQQCQRHSVYICQMENDFVNNVKTLADQFYGLSLEKCHAFVYEFASINKI